MSKGLQTGVEFLSGILATLPEDRRNTVQELIDSTPELATAIGEGVLRQEDYSRNMDAINRRAKEQHDWWEANQPLVDLGQKARAAGFDPAKPATPGLTTPALPENVLRVEDLDKREVNYAQFAMELNVLQARHLKEFGEVMDFTELAKDPRVTQLGLKGVYEATVAPKRAERQKLATDAEVERRVKEGVDAAIKAGGHPSFPSSKPPAGSPLDALAPVANNGADVSDLVDEYNTIRAAMGVAG